MKKIVLLSVAAGVSFATLAADSFNFASWNIGHYMLGKHWIATNTVAEAQALVPKYQAFLAQATPDVIGLCEYNDYLDVDNSVAAADTVFKDYPGSVRTPVDSSIRNAFYWKGAGFYAADYVKFPKTSQNCFYRRAYLQIAGRKVCVVQCHLDWDSMTAGHEQDRTLQIQQLIKDLKNEPYVVLGGDFNTCVYVTDHWEDSPAEFEPFVAAGYTVANRGTYMTWPAGDNAYQSIDNIIVRGFTLSNVAVYGDPTLSDHKLIRATLTFQDETTAALASADYYADPSRPDDSGDGKTPATAKKTLQAAVDLASDGDAVLALPGTYDQGGDAYGTYGNSRLVITNAVTVRGLPGRRADTVIQGACGSDDSGLGEDAWRCVFFGKSGAVVEGVTLAGGATRDKPNNGRWGGAVYSDLYDVYVSDCIVRDNRAWRGGASYRATFTRCYFSSNFCASASRSGSISQQSRFVNCIFDGLNTPSDPAFIYCDRVVNCTMRKLTAERVFGSANGSFSVGNSLLLENSPLVDGGATGFAGFTNCVTDAAASTFRDDGGTLGEQDADQLMSPALSDWRLLSGSPAVGRGDAALLAKVPLPTRLAQTDYNGAPLPTSGTINAGAVQETVTPASGKLILNGLFTRVDGQPLKPGVLRFDTWPTQLELIPSVAGDLPVYGVEASGAATNFRVPDLQGRILVMPPPASVETALTLTPIAASAVLRVGTGEGKLATLQDAVSAATADYTLVYVDAGRYTEGGAKVNGQNSRLAISGKQMRFVGAGAGQSLIVGTRDTTTENGLGENAYRCVSANNASIVQGFTLEGGYSGVSATDLSYYGGAVYGWKKLTQIVDCEIVGCASDWYVVYYAQLTRCRLHACTSVDGGQIRDTLFVNSLIHDTVNQDSDNSGKAIVNAYSELHFSTIVGQPTCQARRYLVTSYNSIFFRSSTYYVTGSTFPCVGDVFYSMGKSDGVVDAVMALLNPKFVSDASDYRLRSDSTAPGYFSDSRCWTSSWPYATYDLDGQPLNIVSGKPTPGCYQWPVKPVTVTVEGGGAVIPASGYVTPDSSLTVAANLNRPFQGFTFKGEALPPTTTNLTLTVADLDAAGSVDLIAKFGTDWYVDAATGDDTHSGAFAADARQTLAGMLSDAKVVSGDTVNVLPGTYTGPVMTYSDNQYRGVAVVKAGVTLKAVQGPSVTTIQGAADETETGLGPQAIRCVIVANGGTVEGFTLTGGATDAKGSAGDAAYGGGALGFSYYNAIVKNCILRNNKAYTAGAGYQCCLVKCRIVDNTAVNRGAVGQNVGLYGCYMDNNLSDNMIDYAYRMENCTVGPHAGTGGVIKNPRDSLTVKNCLVLAGPHAWETKAENSAFVTGHGLDSAKLTNCLVYKLEKYPLHPNGRPLLGNPVVDAGNENLCNWDRIDRDTDLAGQARIVGAALDIGALEAFPMPMEILFK